MGFLSLLFGRSNSRDNCESARFLSDAAFRKNLAKQSAMSPQTVAQLRKYGVTDQTLLKLEFFFYTNVEDKAVALRESLDQLGYKPECRPAADDSRLLLVTGWTSPISMDEDSVVSWTQSMCQLGYEHDCDFDGWGTNPKQ